MLTLLFSLKIRQLNTTSIKKHFNKKDFGAVMVKKVSVIRKK